MLSDEVPASELYAYAHPCIVVGGLFIFRGLLDSQLGYLRGRGFFVIADQPCFIGQRFGVCIGVFPFFSFWDVVLLPHLQHFMA